MPTKVEGQLQTKDRPHSSGECQTKTKTSHRDGSKDRQDYEDFTPPCCTFQVSFCFHDALLYQIKSTCQCHLTHTAQASPTSCPRRSLFLIETYIETYKLCCQEEETMHGAITACHNNQSFTAQMQDTVLCTDQFELFTLSSILGIVNFAHAHQSFNSANTFREKLHLESAQSTSSDYSWLSILLSNNCGPSVQVLHLTKKLIIKVVLSKRRLLDLCSILFILTVVSLQDPFFFKLTQLVTILSYFQNSQRHHPMVSTLFRDPSGPQQRPHFTQFSIALGL